MCVCVCVCVCVTRAGPHRYQSLVVRSRLVICVSQNSTLPPLARQSNRGYRCRSSNVIYRCSFFFGYRTYVLVSVPFNTCVYRPTMYQPFFFCSSVQLGSRANLSYWTRNRVLLFSHLFIRRVPVPDEFCVGSFPRSISWKKKGTVSESVH